ncbi:vesicle-associated membrane protein 7 isoform X2 [Eumetopias jubatus]|uniref:vesicle-associated membrane protein 7 isoform X2 n=1 Tax=Eumetopias jubatus TaxID=34886 RepID=UPI0010168F29|nr:vesicle-associated membrane protein 7 isoform X2 [Eumetopias jubatus]
MAILFAVVARGTTILAKHAWCGGNFLEVTEQILAKIPSENNKLTYSHGNYLFHYICQDRIVYLCITDDDFERSRAFNFLNEIKKRFQTTYGSRAQTALPYAMNSEFSSVLAAQLKHHSENKGIDKVVETQAQVDELKGIMVRNIGVHLYHCVTSLWWIYMAKVCEEIKKKMSLTKDMRQHGVKSDPCDSSL